MPPHGLSLGGDKPRPYARTALMGQPPRGSALRLLPTDGTTFGDSLRTSAVHQILTFGTTRGARYHRNDTSGFFSTVC